MYRHLQSTFMIEEENYNAFSIKQFRTLKIEATLRDSW
jgi:hypothetical protein